MFTLANFYKSDEWEKFRQIVIQERTKPDKFIYCEKCGKPILKRYDLIVHHKEELTEANVNNSMVTLNPDNVELVHFKCHNQIHERFGFGTGGYKPKSKKVYIVYGAPRAGKMQWVREVAGKNDLVVDIDSIWKCITAHEQSRGRQRETAGAAVEKPDALRSIVFDVRDLLYDEIKYRRGKWWNAYIVTTGALKGDRERLTVRVAADEQIFIESDIQSCIERSAKLGDNEKMTEYIKKWFEQYQT